MFDFELFAMRLKEYRNLNGYTQEALSEKIGINLRSLMDIECQKRVPNLKTLMKLLKIFNMTYSEFMAEHPTNSRAALIKAIDISMDKLSVSDRKYVLLLSKSIDELNSAESEMSQND